MAKCWNVGLDPITANIGTLIRSDTIGAVLGAANMTGTSQRLVAGCTWLERRTFSGDMSGQPTGYPNTFTTHVPGVGIRITQTANPLLCSVTTPYSCYGDSRSSEHFGREWGVRAELVRIPGPLGSGNIYGTASVARFNGQSVIYWHINATVPASPTCSVTASNVNLGEVEISRLVDTTYSAPQAFDVRYSGCTARITTSSRFHGTAAPGRSDLFATSGSATGVGIRLTDQTNAQIPPNGTRIHYGVTNGTVIRYLARYERIAQRPTAGSANATLTITSTFN